MRRARGFTLLEVMVALVLVAGALMTLSDLIGSALENHIYARDLSEATLLARGKMAELEQKYQDQGFKDFDEEDDGDFSAEGRPDLHWHLDLLRPNSDLSADQLFAALAGTDADPKELISMLLGGGASAAAASTGSGSSMAAPTAAANPLAGPVGGLLQAQLTQFGEVLKRAFREMRLTISWKEGRLTHAFTVTTHLVVLNPLAPGGARGDNPEVPAQVKP